MSKENVELARATLNAFAELDEAFRRRRHPHLPSHAQKQRLPELLFEQQNLAADRGLGDVQLPPARGERAGLGDCLEDLELAEIHARVGAGGSGLAVLGRS